MFHSTKTTHTILVVSDSTSDATLVEKLLTSEFGSVVRSVDAGQTAKDFDGHKPDVVVLAFNNLEKSQRYYLGLYRLSTEIHGHPHRTIILCNKDEVRRAYECCRDWLFDDYVLFWAASHDPPRLLMAVHHALRELDSFKESGTTSADFAPHVHRLLEAESILAEKMEQGVHDVKDVTTAMDHAEREISETLDKFSRRLIRGDLTDAVTVTNAQAFKTEVNRLQREDIQPHFRAASQLVKPLEHWVHDVKEECAVNLESARILDGMTASIRPTVLVTDDDDFQRQIIAKLLEDESFRLIFASGGIETLNILRKVRPDLILMDVLMPDMDGIEVTRHLKAIPHLAHLPIIFMSGYSEKSLVENAKILGVADFLVKPFVRDVFITKVTRALSPEREALPC